MGKTSIEWATHTFNWLAGCTKVSPACKHCYAETMTARLATMRKSPARYHDGVVEDGDWTGRISYDPAALVATFPTLRRPGVRVFANSMSDTFHEKAPTTSLTDLADAIKSMPASTPGVLMLLTKRPERMAAWQREHFPEGLPAWVWVGCTVEDQRRADERIPHLLRVVVQAGGVRFLSCEPLLGPIDVRRYLPRITGPWGVTPPATWEGVQWPDWVPAEMAQHIVSFWGPPNGRTPADYARSARFGSSRHDDPPEFGARANLRMIRSDEARVEGRYVHAWNNIGRIVTDDGSSHVVSLDTTPETRPWRWHGWHIDWIISGGESGHGARPSHPNWFRSVRDQCNDAGIPYLHKQNGEWVALNSEAGRRSGESDALMVWLDGAFHKTPDGACSDLQRPHAVVCVNKKAAGRLLDGRTHDGMPHG